MFLPNPGILAAGEQPAAVGQVMWTAPGSYSWPVPDGVTSICGLAIGTGGAGASGYSGAGAALAWQNAISVRPGEVLTIRIGSSYGQSAIYRGVTRLVGASDGGLDTSVGTVLTGTGFSGGRGRLAGTGNQRNGGGAGGYTGAGAGATTVSDGYGGGGSSPLGGTAGGGAAGGNSPFNDGGTYGGGGGWSRDYGGGGGPGCVRIIWGPDRAYPNTNTGDMAA